MGHILSRGGAKGGSFFSLSRKVGRLKVRDQGSFLKFQRLRGGGQGLTIMVGRSALVRATVSFGSQQWPPQLGTKKRKHLYPPVERG